MKALITTLALSISTSAFASGPMIALSSDHDFGSETKVYVEQSTKVGSFDAGFLSTKYLQDITRGYDVGYTTPIFVYKNVGVAGRVGYGRLNNIDKTGGGFLDHLNYFTVAGAIAVPLTTSVNAYLQYRHRNTFKLGNLEGPKQHRLQFGVEYAVTKSISTRLGISHARQTGLSGTGVAFNVGYTF